MTHNPEYEAPEIRPLGSISDATAGNSSGKNFDASFSTGDPVPPGGYLY